MSVSQGSGSDSETSVSKAKGRGAPRATVWKHFALSNKNESTNRYTAECNYCEFVLEEARPEAAQQHILQKCKSIPPEIRQEFTAELGKKSSEPLLKALGRKSLKRASDQSPLTDVFDTRKVTAEVKKELDLKLLRMVVVEGLPFKLVDSPWFLDFVHALRPNYCPVGRTTLASMHESFDPSFQPVFTPPTAPTTLGDLSRPVQRIDAAALLASQFPNM